MRRPPRVIGHRGARGLFPENTLEGFQRAFALGVRHFELDAGMTADDVVVVTHDLALNPAITRDANGRWLDPPARLIRDLSYDALRAFDVGRIRPASRYRLMHRHQQAIEGARIPRLTDVLRAIPAAHVIIELKTDPRSPGRTYRPEVMADAVLAIVDAHHAATRVTIESFDWRGPIHIARTRPEITLAWLTSAETTRDAALWWALPNADATKIPEAVSSMGGPIWAPAWTQLSRPDLERAHALGLEVIPWTVNHRAAMRRLRRWGVDGLITDRPDIALSEFQSA